MRKTFWSLSLAVISTTQAMSQNGTLRGTIVGRDKDTLVGAVISVGTMYAATSDATGGYSLSLPVGTVVADCRMTGYSPVSQTVVIRGDEVTRCDFRLKDRSSPLDEVVISAERYAQKLGEVTVSTEVLKPALIENKNITSLDQALAQVPGVVVADGQASIRGGSGFSYGAGSRVLMLVDEVPMISADAGDIKWNFLPLETMNQVEVVKGASSVLYGSGALNGIVNLRTSFAGDKPRTTATAFYGRYDAPRHTYKWWKGSSQAQRGMSVSHAQKIGNLDVVIGANKFSDDGYRMLETESRDRFNAGLKYTFKKTPALSMGVNTNMMNVKGGLFFLWQNYDSAYVPQGRKIQNYNNGRFNVDPWLAWTVNGPRNYKVSLRNRYFKTHNSNDKNQSSYAELYYSELQYATTIRKTTITAGAVRMEQVILSDSIYGTHRGHNYAGYAQVTQKFFNRLTVTAGVRAEYFQQDSVKTTGYWLNNGKGKQLPFQPVARAGINYHAARETYFRASFGQGYRFPSVAEKFVSTSVSTLKIFPNPQLQPERAYSAEASVKQGFRIGGFSAYADLAAFYTRYRNMVEFVFDIYRPGGATGSLANDFAWAGFKSQNIGDAIIRGAEISISGTGNLGPLKISTLTGYTYIDPVFAHFDPQRDTLGLAGVKTLKYRSRHLFKTDVQVEYGKWSIGYSARYQSRIENIDRRFVESVLQEYSTPTFNFGNIPSTYILPGLKENFGAFSKPFTVQDARIAYQLSAQVRISLIVNNFTNVEYQNRPGDVRPPTMYIGQVMLKI